MYCLPFVQVKAVNPGYLWRNCVAKSVFMLYFVILIGIARQDEVYFRNDLHEKRVVLSALFIICAG